MQQEHEDSRTFPADGGEWGALLRYRRDSLAVKMKHKSNLLELSTVSNGDLLSSLAIPGPKHSMATLTSMLCCTLLAIQPRGLGSADGRTGNRLCWVQHLPGQYARTLMFQDKILITIFLLRDDGLEACDLMSCEVTTLAQISESFCESRTLYNPILSPQWSGQERFLLSLGLCLQAA